MNEEALRQQEEALQERVQELEHDDDNHIGDNRLLTQNVDQLKDAYRQNESCYLSRIHRLVRYQQDVSEQSEASRQFFINSQEDYRRLLEEYHENVDDQGDQPELARSRLNEANEVMQKCQTWKEKHDGDLVRLKAEITELKEWRAKVLECADEWGQALDEARTLLESSIP